MDKKAVLFLLIILVIAGFFRFWKLDVTPPGLYPDVALNATQAINEPFKVFYPENFGREGLMMTLIYFSFQIFGRSIWALKFVAAIFGFLTVLGLYLLTTELFYGCQKKRAQLFALFATFFFAISFWHVNFSRIGFRVILLPFTSVFAFYFLYLGLRTKKIWALILGGIFFGLGFYTYTAFRIIVLLLILVLFDWFLVYKKEKSIKKFIGLSFIFLIVTFFVALPIGLYFLHNPQEFISRVGPVSVFKTERPVFSFEESLILHLGMFNVFGDPNWRHNYSGSPLLPLPIGIFFLIGILYSISRALSRKKQEFESQEMKGIFGFLIFWWIVMLIPGIITYEGIPHALRTLGAAPPTYIFAGIGATLFFGWLKKIFIQKNIKFLSYYFLIFILLFTLALFAYRKYFVLWAYNPKVSDSFTQRFVDVGYALNVFPEGTTKYVIKIEGDLPTEVTKFIQLTQNRNEAIYVNLNQINSINLKKGDVVFTMNQERWPIDTIARKFPGGEVQQFPSFWIYKY